MSPGPSEASTSKLRSEADWEAALGAGAVQPGFPLSVPPLPVSTSARQR